MLLAILLTTLAAGAALAVASRRRIHRAILALVAAFVALGAVIGSIPGAFVLIGLVVGAATGPPTGINWAFWTTLAASGTLAGLALVGVGVSAIVLALTSSTDDRLLFALPALVTATSVLGFVIPRTR